MRYPDCIYIISLLLYVWINISVVLLHYHRFFNPENFSVMKKTEVKQPANEKPMRPNTNPGKPQQPQQEKTQRNRQLPEQSQPKKARPEEWQAIDPSEYQAKQRRSDVELDDFDDVEDVEDFEDIDHDETEEE